LSCCSLDVYGIDNFASKEKRTKKLLLTVEPQFYGPKKCSWALSQRNAVLKSLSERVAELEGVSDVSFFGKDQDRNLAVTINEEM
jgi:hypothetical protein